MLFRLSSKNLAEAKENHFKNNASLTFFNPRKRKFQGKYAIQISQELLDT